MNKIVNNFLLMGDKFIREMHLKQPGFTYSACVVHLPKIKKDLKSLWKYRFSL